MTKREHPYRQYKNHPAWGVLVESIEKLVNNADLAEKTDRAYIVGLIIQDLDQNGYLSGSVPRATNEYPAERSVDES